MSYLTSTQTEYMIDLGKVFIGDYLFTAVADAGVTYIRINNPSTTKKSKVSINLTTEGKVYVDTFTGTTYTGAGTVVPLFNLFTDTTETPTLVVYHTPTINVLGTQRINGMIGGSSNGYVQMGGSTATLAKTVIGPGKDVLVRVTNKAGSAKDIGVSVNWYEE